MNPIRILPPFLRRWRSNEVRRGHAWLAEEGSLGTHGFLVPLRFGVGPNRRMALKTAKTWEFWKKDMVFKSYVHLWENILGRKMVCGSSSCDSSQTAHFLTMHHFRASTIGVLLTPTECLVASNLLPSYKKMFWIEAYPGITNLPVKDLLVSCVVVAGEVNFPSSTDKWKFPSNPFLLVHVHPFHFFQAVSFWAIASETEVSRFGHLRMSWPTWVQRMPCARLPIWESDFLIPWRITPQKSLPQDSSDLIGKNILNMYALHSLVFKRVKTRK